MDRPDAVTAAPGVRLHGARAGAITMGVLSVMLAGAIELAMHVQQARSGWRWVPIAALVLVALLVVRNLAGVSIRPDGDVLVIRRFAARRIAASQIAGVELSDPLGERVELVLANGRAWSFTASGSSADDRAAARDLIDGWLSTCGGPAPLQTGPMTDGDLVGFRPGRDVLWAVLLIPAIELALLVGTVTRLATDTTLGHWIGGLALVLEVAALGMFLRVGRGFLAWSSVEHDQLVIHRPGVADRRIDAGDIDAIQFTSRRGQPGLRVRTPSGWRTVPCNLLVTDRAVTVTRFVDWATRHGARLQSSRDAPARLSARSLVWLVVLAGSLVIGMEVAMPLVHLKPGGSWGVLVGPLLVAFTSATETVDAQDVAGSGRLGDQPRAEA